MQLTTRTISLHRTTGEKDGEHTVKFPNTQREKTLIFLDTISYLFLLLLLLLLPPSLLLLQPFSQNSVTTRLAAACETKQAASSVTGVAAKGRAAPRQTVRSDTKRLRVCGNMCVYVCV